MYSFQILSIELMEELKQLKVFIEIFYNQIVTNKYNQIIKKLWNILKTFLNLIKDIYGHKIS